MSKNCPFNYSANPDISAIEAEIAFKANIASPTFTGTVTLPGNPSTDLEAATKGYVDAGLQGLSPKPTPKVATTTTLPSYTYTNGTAGVGAKITMTATGIVAIDGHNLVYGDRVLIKDEGAGASPYNGLYDVTTAGAVGVALVLTRNTSMDSSTEFAGAYLLVDIGSINAGAGFWCTNSTNPIVGTDNIIFAQFNNAASITAGTGLQKIGNTLLIDSTVTTLTGSQALTNKTINGLTPAALATGFTIAGGTTSKTLTVPLDASVSGTNTGDQTTISGNAGTATALQNARTIGGVSFDGTTNIVPQTIQSVNEATDTTCFPLFISASGTQSLQPLNNAGFTYNSNTNNVGATTFTGALAGNATTSTTLATARAIYGNNFDGSAALTQIITSTYGGTGNGFAKISGPASTEKTFTLPNASSTILTDNSPVTVPQGGTGLSTLTTAYGVVCAGTTATGVLQNAGAGTIGQYLKSGGASALPSFTSFVAPTIQKFTSGSGTYTTPANTLYIRVRMVGAGAGGSGSGTAAGAGVNGSNGGNTTFGTTLLVANGGSAASMPGAGGTGGSASLGSGPIGTTLVGGQGEGYSDVAAVAYYIMGGSGGSNPYGYSPGGTANANANNAPTNSGQGGGGGGGGSGVGMRSGAGGGAGGYVDALILSPSATYAYAVGAAGAGGSAGTSGFAGGAGGSGYIEVTEYYT